MKHETHDMWTELAFDPARHQRIAEAARHEAMDSLFTDLLRTLKRKIKPATKC